MESQDWKENFTLGQLSEINTLLQSQRKSLIKQAIEAVGQDQSEFEYDSSSRPWIANRERNNAKAEIRERLKELE